MRMWIGLAFLALGAGGAAAGAPVETIVVHERFPEDVCSGKCIDYDLTARANGTAELRTGSAMGTMPKKTFRYTITAEEFAAFKAALAAIRPTGEAGPTGTCNPRTHIIDWDIRWQDDAPAHLRACGADPAGPAVAAGLKALRISAATGERLPDAPPATP